MREIPLKKRMEVLGLYFEGLSYDEISRKAKVSKGSVVNIVRELREGKYPEFEDLSEIVDELRSLAVEINKNKISVAQAVLGIKFYEKLQKLGIEPKALESYIKMCKSLSPEFARAAVRLYTLEREFGKRYEEIVEEFEENTSKIRKLYPEIKALEERKRNLENDLKKLEERKSLEIAKIEELIKGAESLQRIGVEKVCRLSTFVEEFEKLGYSADELAKIARLADKRDRLIKENLRLRNDLNMLAAENRGILAAKVILETRTVAISCQFCGGSILCRLPTIFELFDAMKRNTTYSVRCPFCNFMNYFTPRDVLASIGWAILYYASI